MRVENPVASANSVNGSEHAKTGADGVQLAALDVAAAAQPQKAPVAIQANATHITPGPDGTVRLPEGVSLEQISVSGRDLVIQLPNGDQIIIDDGAVYVPQLVLGGVEIPAVNLAALLIGNEPQPAAGGPQSSGGNFARAVGDIGPGIGIGNLLPPTALEFSPPEFEEVYPAVDDDEPTVIIFPEDQPGAPDVSQTTSDAGLPGGSDEGSGSNQTTGTITFHSGDTPAHVTINGIDVFPGQIIPSEHGYLEIISVNNGDSPDGFVEYVFVQTENVLHPAGSNDVFEEIFEVVVTDADGDVATGSLTINILDDFPEAHADVDSVSEHGPTVANGNVMTGTGGADANNTDGVADFQGADDAVVVIGVAAGSQSSASGSVGSNVQGSYGTLNISSTGAYTYTLNPNHSAVNALDTGETLTDTFTYTIRDADQDVSTTTVTITINGANDAPDANPDTNWVLDVSTGANPTATGNVLQNQSHPNDPSPTLSFADQADTDVDVETLTVSNPGTYDGTYGTLVLNGNGSYTYTLDANHPDVNALDEGETLTETFNYTSTDGTASDSSTLTITIFGTNDAPTIGTSAVTVSEEGLEGANDDTTGSDDTTDDASVSGHINVGDIDADTLSVSLGDPGAVLTSGGQPVTWEGVGTGTLTGSVGDTEIIVITIEADGDYTVTLKGPVDHADETVEDDLSFDIPVSVSDGTTTTTGGVITVTIEDDSPLVTLRASSDSEVTLTTQDAETIGAAFDTATADFSEIFTAVPSYGADGAGSTVVTYSMTLLAAAGADSGLSSDGDTIYLYDVDGVITGSTSATADGVSAANTIFTLEVDADTGVVTSTQYAEVDHDLPGSSSNYDSQLATLGNELVGVTATVVVTDADDDTATDSETVDLGGNVRFADDGPSVTVTTDGEADVLMTTQDAETIGSAFDTATGDFSGAFTVTPSYDADGAGTTVTTYALALAVAEGSDSGLASDGDTIYLYEDGGVIIGSTSATEDGVDAANTIFTLEVDADTGVVTSTQYAEVDHDLPGSSSNYDSQLATLGNGLVTLTATAVTTDGDGDTATDSESIDLGGNVRFADDGPSVTVTTDGEADVLMTTQDAETIGSAFDTATGDFSGAFTVTPSYDADGAGTTVTTYALALAVAEGSDSGLASDGDTIYLYEDGGVIIGSTSATEDGVDAANTIFTLEVDADTGVVTSTQYAEVDHDLPGSSSNYDSQLATLGNGLVTLTATAVTTDGDGDTATDSESIDLGGNVRFADDGPSVTVVAGADGDVDLTTEDASTIGAAFDTATADLSDVFTVTPSYDADGPGTTVTTYAMTLLVADGSDSGLASDGDTIYLYDVDGVITGSTSATADGVSAANTIFTLEVDADTGVVTSTQYAEVDHDLPGDSANYEDQLATLGNGLVGVTATAVTTDGDGDTATDSDTVDLGGNVHFADDGPSVTVTTDGEADVLMTTQDAETIGSAFDTATGDFSGAFTVTPSYDADGAGTTVTTYALALAVAEGSDSGLSSDGDTIYLYEDGGVIIGSTSATEDGVDAANTIFTLEVDASTGIVTSTQYAEVDHDLPGSSSNYDSQLATLGNGLVTLTATAVTTDGDGDTATDSESVDLGGNVRFADDGPSVTVTTDGEADVLMTTQDAETIGSAFDTATGDFSGAFTVTPSYDADGAGTTVTTYALALAVAEGSDSGLASDGDTIYLYEDGGVIIGSTSATEDGVDAANTIFTLEVDADTGVVTSTQYAEVDHDLPGSSSNYDSQLATLGNGLVTLTATAVTTDGDGDTATDSESVDLGGNVRFADDGPSVTVVAGADGDVDLTTEDASTIGAAFDTATADLSGVFTVTPSYDADGAGTTVTTYAMTLLVAEGTDSGLASDGDTIYLYDVDGVITGSTSATAEGVSAANTIFTLEVDADTGVVTSTQYAEVDHDLPGDSANYEDQLATLGNGLVGVTATAVTTDGDGDTATDSDTVDLGGNVHFADDGPSVTVTTDGEADVLMTTQDAETIGSAFDTATGDFSGAFTVTPSYDADGAGTTVTTYALALAVAEGSDSGLASDGDTIYLYEDGGVIIGSTSATEDGVDAANTIFTLEVDASTGIVTSTQYAEVDHDLPGSSSNYDSQLATLGNGLVTLTATAVTTDGDGDTATDSESVDLGGNVRFADDGPSVTVVAGADAGVLLTTQDADTIGAATDTNTADFSTVFTVTPSYDADGPGTTVTTYAMTLLVADGTDSGLNFQGANIYLYEDGGLIIGSTAATEDGVTAGNTIFTLSIDSSTGVVTQTQYAEIHHDLPGSSTNFSNQLATLANGLVGVTATAVTTDGDGDTATDSETVDLGGNVRFADDGPDAFDPQDATMVNDGVAGTGDAETFALNFFEAVGADASTVSAVFVDTNLTDNYLYKSDGTSFVTASDGEKIILSGWGTNTLTGYTETSNELVVTITLNPSGTVEANDLYTVDFEMPLDDGSGVDLETFSFVRAGNQSYNGLNDVTGATLNQDLLFSATKAGVQSTVNTNATAVGVANQSMNDDETLRIDFVENVTFQPASGNVSGYDYDEHFDINNFQFAIVQKGGSTTNGTIDIWVRIYDAPNDPDTANDYTALTNDTQSTDTATFYVNGVEVVPSVYDPVKGYLIEGLSLNDVIKVSTDDGYNRIEIENGIGGTFSGETVTSGDSFDIGQFGFDVVGQGSNQVLQDITVQGTDADGDTSTGVINITTTPVPVAPIALDLNGDGVRFVAQAAGVTFDYFGAGHAVSTAWVDPNDGILAIDKNGDGVVNDGSEIIFSVAGSTDLEGLAATYDSNHDGVLSAADADFAKFGVLQNGEFTSLSDAGIESIGLASDGVAYTAADGQVQVFGEGTFTWSDGSTGTLADAAFAYSAAAQDAQRVFGQNAGSAYANLLAAAAMITAAATGFAAAEAPLLNAIGVEDFLGDVTTQQLETFSAQIETNRTEIIDAFDGGAKEGTLVHDSVHFSQDLSNLLEASGFEAPQADEVLSTLLANTDMAPSLHDAAPMLVDMTVMPMIETPLQAIAQSAPAAAGLVAEVLADALSGGAQNTLSIDDMLAALPSTGGGATIGLSQEFGGGAMVLALHPMAFHEASLVLHQDSVPVT